MTVQTLRTISGADGLQQKQIKANKKANFRHFAQNLAQDGKISTGLTPDI
ncbi:MAG: hypothetical protein JST89_11405 [Cyanobacteria bacterium SZAS-4]|nr:hypothetical protein [Cyanobacteria bacterium SZAS-4]